MSDDIEFAMCEGMQISVNNGSGISISSTGITARNYKIDGLQITVDLIPRTERWYGSHGLYKPSGENGLHMVLDEGQQHFYSEAEALDWLAQLSYQIGLNVRYTSDGLVVGWKKETNIALQVQVWQIFIKGMKPQALPGASDSEISVYLQSGDFERCMVVGDFEPSPPRMIAGRQYFGRAIDLMLERGVTADDVAKVIANGRRMEVGKYVMYSNPVSFKAPSFVLLNDQGIVITII